MGETTLLDPEYESKEDNNILNKKDCYRCWIYFGNYSSTHGAIIKFGVPPDPHKLKKLENVNIFFPSIETINSRVPAKVFTVKELGTPLHWACLSGQYELVKYLCENKELNVDLWSTVEQYNATGKDIALQNGYYKLARYLDNQMKLQAAAKK